MPDRVRHDMGSTVTVLIYYLFTVGETMKIVLFTSLFSARQNFGEVLYQIMSQPRCLHERTVSSIWRDIRTMGIFIGISSASFSALHVEYSGLFERARRFEKCYNSWPRIQ